MNNDLYELVRNIGPQLVSLFTLLICLVVTLVRWKRHPAVSAVLSLAILLVIIQTLLYSITDVWVPRVFVSSGYTEDDYFKVAGIVASSSFAIVYAIFLVAIFMKRKTTTPQ